MDTNEKEIKKNRLWGLWATVNDFESAIEAARSAQFVAFWLSISYALNLVFLFWTGESLFGDAPRDNIEFYASVFIFILFALLFLLLGFRIRKNRFGSVPFLAVWTLFEITYKLFAAPGKGIIISLIFFVISINSLRGWFGIKKYWFSGNPLEKISKPISKLGRLLVSIIFIFILVLCSFGMLKEIGIVPDDKVTLGKDLRPDTRMKLVSNNIILESDKIIYFYSEGLLSVMDGGQLLTEDRIVTYETGENNQLVIYQMLYKNIKTIELVEQGSSILNSSYKIYGNENASYGFIIIFLPGTDTKFIKELESHLVK